MEVKVRDNQIDRALKTLKRKMQAEGIFREMRMREAYEKPSAVKRRRKAEAVRRHRKELRKRDEREGLIPPSGAQDPCKVACVMAVDVIIRSDAGCITIVHDDIFDDMHSVILEGRKVFLLSGDGKKVKVGKLVSSLAEAAALCTIAVVVKMDGDYVVKSNQAKFVVS